MNHFLAEILSTPWALQPERMRAYSIVLAREYLSRGAARRGADDARELLTVAEGDSRGPRAAAKHAGGQRPGSIAVIPVYGAITQRASMMSMCDGGTSTQALSQALQQANADETISSIILDIDSPGGSVFGIAELAAEIRASAKPVTAVANSLAASAAYWLGSAASEFFVTPGGEVGSIGVWMAHEDWSKAYEEAGVQTTLISAGKFKVEGNPFGPLDAEAVSFLQSRVDDYFQAFTADVAKGRKVGVAAVRGGMGQGRVLGASAARAENMVDGVKTFAQVVDLVAMRASSPVTGRRGSRASAANAIALLS